MATPIITDGSLDRVRKTPRVVLPVRADIFAERAARFASVAAGNAMSGYLQLMAKVARAQQSALASRTAGAVPEAAMTASREYGMPPLSAQSHERSSQWRADLADIVSHVRAQSHQWCAGRSRPSSTRSTRRRRNHWPTVCWRVLRSTTKLRWCRSSAPRCKPISRGSPRRWMSTLVEQCDIPGICPVCASRPVASVLRIGGEQANLRYLVCSLCATEWNMSRIQCTSCDTDKGVKYLVLQAEGDSKTEPAARAETCDECKSYLKIFYQEKDPQLDPTADDLATLALDLLVDEQGYARSGPNLLFHPGSS